MSLSQWTYEWNSTYAWCKHHYPSNCYIVLNSNTFFSCCCFYVVAVNPIAYCYSYRGSSPLATVFHQKQIILHISSYGIVRNYVTMLNWYSCELFIVNVCWRHGQCLLCWLLQCIVSICEANKQELFAERQPFFQHSQANGITYPLMS